MSGLNEAVKKVFDERSKFVVFGLTGRTGAGCTTTADLLAKEFTEFSAPTPVVCSKMSSSDRQYKVSYDYLSHNWASFVSVRAADVISSFILEYDFDEFFRCYLTVLESDQCQDIGSKFIEYKNVFSQMHKERLETKEKIECGHLKDEQIYDFSFRKLGAFSLDTRKILDLFSKGSYIKFYQLVANNIRKSGRAYNSNFVPGSIFMLAQRMNSFVKILRERQRDCGGKVFVCIDSLRNSFEVTYFRERYAAFYLVALSAEEEERRRRLRAKFDFGDETISGIDSKESPSSLKGESYYYSQNVPKCIEMADIHLENPKDANAFEVLKKQLIRYVSLVMHPGLVQPTDIERCMQVALNAKFNSGCLSRQVGAVITDPNFSVKAIGWNDSPEGQERCSVRSFNSLLKHQDRVAYSDYELNDKNFRNQFNEIYGEISEGASLEGWPASYCFKDIRNCIDEEKNQVHTRALHAEENAFLQITKYGGQGILGGILFTTSSPCELCAKKAYQLGIVQVYYLDPYPGISGSHVLGIGLNRPKVSLFSGAVGRGYQQLFDPIMPQKEALAHLLGVKLPNKKAEMVLKIERLTQECERLSKENNDLTVQLSITSK